VIRFEGVSKIYSTDVVLKNINWEIKKGEKIGLVGSNGAGKSTQFKIKQVARLSKREIRKLPI
jgi:ATP-binding cassette subfamily F protein 3